MSLRRLLVLPLLVSLGFFVFFSQKVWESFGELMAKLHLSPALILVLLAATVLQIAGHIVRAYKARLILMEIKESSVRFQFRALTIGYLFNTILPFRLGELVRARIVSGAMSISFSLALVLVIFERAVDAVILGLLGLLLFSLAGLDAPMHATLLLLAAGLAVMTLLALFAQSGRYIKILLYKTSWMLNDQLKNSFRFKAWSVTYGLQRIMKSRLLANYVGLSMASWTLYGLSVLIIVQYLFAGSAIPHKLVAAAAPYFGVAFPAGPANLGSFSSAANRILDLLPGVAGNGDIFTFTLLSWAVLTVPVALVGVILLLFKTHESFWYRLPRSVSLASLHNKLDRSGDISAEMSVFLENYFAGNTLSTIVHRLEVQDNFKLLRYFKGGSDAITILVAQHDQTVVKKIIPLEFENRLRAQYDWLAEYQGVDSIVQVFDDAKTDDYYTIDMSFDPDDAPLFEYVHNRPLKQSQAVFNKSWRVLDKHVYARTKTSRLHAGKREAYIEKHINGCLEIAGAVDPELLRAAEPDTLVINGHEYDNLRIVLQKIKAHSKAWKDIGTYAESRKVHGDVIVDNLLVNKKTDDVLIIDPAPDGNIIEGKVFDFGKNMQSLYCGYEFLLRDESPVYLRDDNRIDFADATSVQYAKLCEYVRTKVAPRYLNRAEQRAILFHAAALFIRRLKHQVYYTPANAMKFYAVGVKTMNDFLAQYEQFDQAGRQTRSGRTPRSYKPAAARS